MGRAEDLIDGGSGDRVSFHLSRIRPQDWRELREVRLNALREAPQAFIADHSEELEWLEQAWRQAIDQARWVVARSAGRVVGVARSTSERDAPGQRHIEAVWVEPRFRRRGVGRRLVQWLIKAELEAGITDILIWVIDTNEPARQLYEGIGFKPTGERQPVPSKGDRVEERLKLPID